MLDVLAKYYSPTFGRYIEPFMGSAALFFQLQPSRAILSDINIDLVNTFRSIAIDPSAVFEHYRNLANDREQYYKIRERMRVEQDILLRSSYFIYLNRYCFNGLYRTNRKGHFNVPYSGRRTGSLPSLEELRGISSRLANVHISNDDFELVMYEHVIAGDFIYLDPPFAVSNRRIFHQYDASTFGRTDIARLASALNLVNDRGAFFLLSYADCEDARAAFSAWPISQVVSTTRNISGFASRRKQEKELLISNIVEL